MSLKRGELRARVLDYLKRHTGQHVPLDALINHVYGDDPDGGPLKADANIRVAVSQLRKEGHLIGAATGYVFGRETGAYLGLRRQ